MNFTDACDIVMPLRPGERMIEGRPYVVDQDALNDHVARTAINVAPSDMSGLTDAQLTVLKYQALRMSMGAKWFPAVDGVLARVCSELAIRGMR